MLSATLRNGLAPYEIGEKIRALRLRKKMGLVELGKHTGLSPAMLSKIERGKLFPTLPTLLRVALVFSVGLEYFFAGAREKPVVAVVRKRDRIRFADSPDGGGVNFHFESLDYPATERRLNAYVADFEAVPADRLRMHDHPGAELIYVLRGTLAVHIGEEDYVLAVGDSMYFDSGVAHGYRRIGTRPTGAIVVTTA
jgi:transcriptional regulator with XRE-family HTH domain